jgi:hypothetical protein
MLPLVPALGKDEAALTQDVPSLANTLPLAPGAMTLVPPPEVNTVPLVLILLANREKLREIVIRVIP